MPDLVDTGQSTKTLGLVNSRMKFKGGWGGEGGVRGKGG